MEKKVFVLFLIVSLTLAITNDAPQQIHIHFSGEDDQIVISWVSFEDKSEETLSEVTYGLTSGGVLDQVSQSEPTLFNTHPDQERRLMHNVLLLDLIPGETYSYICKTVGGSVESKEYSFEVMDEETMTFAVFGDLNDLWPETILGTLKDSITNEAKEQFVILAGDMAYNLEDNNGTRGDDFFNTIQDEGLARQVPWMFVPGNHEFDEVTEDYTNFNFRMIGQEYVGELSGSNSAQYYSWDQGLVHFVALNTDSWIWLDKPAAASQAIPQLLFLQNDLKDVDRDLTPWIIVIGHRPIYCSSTDTSRCLVQSAKLSIALEQIFVVYKVNLYISGHVHHYERSWPTRLGFPTQFDYDKAKYPVYILTGLAGSGKDEFTDLKPLWAAYRDEDFRISYTRISILTHTIMNVQQISAEDGKNFDSFTLVRSSSAQMNSFLSSFIETFTESILYRFAK